MITQNRAWGARMRLGRGKDRGGAGLPFVPPAPAGSQGPELAMAAPGAAPRLSRPAAPVLALPPPPALSPALSARYPTAAEMSAIANPADLFLWAGLTGTVGDAATVVGVVTASLEGATIADMHYVSEADFSTLLAAVRVQDPCGA